MRTIPSSLMAHKLSDATTLCKLLRVTAQDGQVVGMTTLDQDVTYDDGQGVITYRAPVGFQPASIYESLGFEVDNTESSSLVVPEYNIDLDEFSVNAGKWDYAKFALYEVNYEDLSQGHWLVMSGRLGQMRTVDGIQVFGELRSIADLFRRPIVQLDSLTCRAIFGSDSSVERFPCGFDAESLWVSGVVTSVGVEANRTFTDSALTDPAGHYEPGLLQWLTGNNAGKYLEIETSQADGTISLAFPASYEIEVGDTFRIRRDCNKRARDTEKGCAHFFGSSWGLHFRGEPDIPIGNEGTLQGPGAGI